jgi:hypothetical protein
LCTFVRTRRRDDMTTVEPDMPVLTSSIERASPVAALEMTC